MNSTPLQHEDRPNKVVLVVEDTEDMQFLVKEILGEEGFTVLIASHGQEALEILRSNPNLPAVILLDLMMPVMDGFTFRSEQLKDPHLAKIPVLVMTAAADIEEKAQKLGANGFIKKGMGIDELLAAVTPFCL
jgi:CheY-like chemotaxis protein